jgi:hypothetical protein
MKKSPYTQMQIDNSLSEMEMRTSRMKNMFSIIVDRIQKLRKEGFFLETVFINSQYVEQLLKLVIDGHASRRRILTLLGEKDIFEDVKLQLEDEETLGRLIGLIRRVHGNPELLRRLEVFNELRKEAIHHIYDGARELEPFNKGAGDYLASTEFTKLLEGIENEQKKVRGEIEKMAKLAKDEKV